jgi:truncated hemoglobin YjbI
MPDVFEETRRRLCDKVREVAQGLKVVDGRFRVLRAEHHRKGLTDGHADDVIDAIEETARKIKALADELGCVGVW